AYMARVEGRPRPIQPLPFKAPQIPPARTRTKFTSAELTDFFIRTRLQFHDHPSARMEERWVTPRLTLEKELRSLLYRHYRSYSNLAVFDHLQQVIADHRVLNISDRHYGLRLL